MRYALPAILVLAFFASPLFCGEGTAREKLLAEDFDGARAALAAEPAGTARDALASLIDECELAAICDTASGLLDARDGAAALKALTPAFARFGSSDGKNGKPALSSLPRLRGLMAVARALPAKAGAEDSQYAAMLKQLDAAVATAEQDETKRQAAITAAQKSADDGVKIAGDSLAAGDTAAAKTQSSVALDAYARAESSLLRAFTSLAAARRILDPADYDARRAALEKAVNPLYERTILGIAQLHYLQKNITEALRVVDRGLGNLPLSRAMLEMRVKIEEWKRYTGKDE